MENEENTTPLNELLSGAESPPEPQEQPETIGVPRDEHGRFAPRETGEAVETPQQEGPPPSETEQSHIPLAALKDERTKRQQIEDDLRAARAQLQQYEAYFQQAQPQPTVDDDPVAFIASQVREQLAPQVQQELLTARVQITEAMARERWADYDEKVELFKAEAEANPFLWRQVLQAPDPARFAYNAATQISDAKKYGSEAPLSREKLEAEIREKILAEIGMSQRQAPATLATERSAGSRSGPAWSGPASLSELLGS